MRVVLGKLNDELLENLAIRASAYCSQVDAAVAYAQNPGHPLLRTCRERKLRLVFYGLLDEDGAVGVPLLRELLSWGPSRADVRLVKGNYHPKVIWWRGFGAYVGSANLTNNGWYNNLEAGVFIDEGELASTGASDELDDLFDYLAENSIPVTNELLGKLEQMDLVRRPAREQALKIRGKFNELFAHVPNHSGLIAKPPKGVKKNNARQRFTAEWMDTLQLMRGLAREFLDLGMRPRWVDADAHPVVHFDQFLHAYYYDYVRGGGSEDEDQDEPSGLTKIEASFEKHTANPAKALNEAAQWWAALPAERYGEEGFIRHTAPGMQSRLSKSAIQTMDLQAFTEALRNVNAFRMHARQVRNVEFDLPADHHESIEQRVNRLCAWLWSQRSKSANTVRDVLEFVLWGTNPTDMEQRLWLSLSDDNYRIAHFGQSTLGEAVGWARPNEYPPRNNRTNKALRCLGHDVKLFSNI